jgi:hypothetical protein
MALNWTTTTPTPAYDLSVFRSNSANSVAGTWSLAGNMLVNSTQPTAKGCVLPASSGGNMWAVYVYDGTVASRKYAGTWGSQSVLRSPAALGSNTEDAPPSAVVDARGVLHAVYGDDNEQPAGTSTPHIYYRYNTGSAWSAEVPLSSIGNSDGFKYPTLSLDASTGNLYAFWYDMQTQYVVCRMNVSGTWSTLALNAQTADPKAYLTSIYSAPSPTLICYQWVQNATNPMHVIFDRIPEFSDAVLPVLGMVFIVAIFATRTREREGKD